MFHLSPLRFRYASARAIRNVCVAVGLIFSAPAWAEPITLVALGDSLTAGYGLAPEAGLVPQLQAWLTEQGRDVVVINAGVSGDTTAGGLSRLEWSLTPETDALIVELGGHISVGLGDDRYASLGQPTNADIVRAVAQAVRDAGGEIATPGEARAILSGELQPA